MSKYTRKTQQIQQKYSHSVISQKQYKFETAVLGIYQAYSQNTGHSSNAPAPEAVLMKTWALFMLHEVLE